MEPLPATPPARGTSRGYNPERPNPFPSARPGTADQPAWKSPWRPAAAFRPRPFPLPGRPRTAGPGLPARRRSGSAGYLRGAAPLFVERRARDLLPRPRLRPASRLPPAAPGPRRHRRRLPQHRTSSRGRLRRVPSPPPPHHVPHPGLRHRETRSRPAWVGRPEARPSAPAAGPECRPEACSGHDTLPAGPPRPLAWRVPPGPGSSPHPRVLGTPPVHSWADAPRLNRPLLCQRHSNILRV